MALCSHFNLLVGFCARAGRTRVFAWLPSTLSWHAVLLRCPGARTTSLRRKGTVACCVSCALRERSVDSSFATEERVFPCASISCAPQDHPQACEGLAARSRVRVKVAHENGFTCKVPIVGKRKTVGRWCNTPVNCNVAAWTHLKLSCPETGHRNEFS